MVYDFTSMENTTDLVTVFQTVNTSSNEWFVLLIIMSLFIVAFISFKQHDTMTALRTASFMTAIISVLFFTMGFLSLEKMLIPIIMLMVMIFLSFAISE